jgi:serine-type D-Ala-D-Ala endopeptidase (penicillin-binding protein 7)
MAMMQGFSHSFRSAYFVVGVAVLAVFIAPAQVFAASEAVSIYGVELGTGRVQVASHAGEVRPIASLTKLATAMALLDSGIDLEESIRYDPKRHSAYRNWLRFQQGDELRGRDVWYLFLVGSQNIPARMLVDLTALSEEEIIAAMNANVQRLGLAATRFVDVHGLSPENVSTAAEIARLFETALTYPDIADALKRRAATIAVQSPNGALRELTFRHTNVLLRDWQSFATEASKTGYLDEALDCLATLVRDPATGKRFVMVVLGEARTQQRFRKARSIMNQLIDAPSIQLASRTISIYLPLSSFAIARRISVF